MSDWEYCGHGNHKYDCPLCVRDNRIAELEDKLNTLQRKLDKIHYMARCLIHTDKSCSLEAQGFCEIECAEIATEDSIAREIIGLITGEQG